MPAPWYRPDGADLLLDVHVQPGARHDRIDGTHGQRLKIRINAPPIEGRANAQLVRFLASVFGVARNRVVLVSGESARSKRLRIRGTTELPAQLAAMFDRQHGS